MKLSDFVCVEAIRPELAAAERDEVMFVAGISKILNKPTLFYLQMI